MFGLNATLMLAVALVSKDALKEGVLPFPAKYIWIVVIWSVLGIIGEAGAPQLAAVFGVGLVLALAYNLLTPGKKLRGVPKSDDDDIAKKSRDVPKKAA